MTKTEYTISQSALTLFEKCPYAYKLKYINKCQRMFFDPSILDMGSYVHDAIDKYYRNGFMTTGTADDILAETYNELKKIWDISFLPEQLKKAYTCLENHAQWEYTNILQEMRTKPFTELKIKRKGYYGIVDYFDLPIRKAVDLKTGANAYISREYRIQAHVYKTVIDDEFNVQLDDFWFFFLYSNQWRRVNYNDEKQRKIAEETEKLKEELIHALETGEFEKKPRLENACKYCDLLYYCKVRGI